MISTKNIITKASDLDPIWCFKHLLNITENLNGQDIKIKSPFSVDRTPSFSIFKKEGGNYRFSCFSTGISGNHIELFMALQKRKGIELTYGQAVTILKKEFEAFQATGQYIPQSVSAPLNGKGRVIAHEVRRYNKEDIDYWKKYYITDEILDEYNVAPLSKFIMKKLKDGVEHEYVFDSNLQFGYFTSQGELFEIYQPLNRKNKCIKVTQHIKGIDQCTKPATGWLCTEALKECMGFRALGIDDWHIVGADSANIPLPTAYLKDVNNTYPKRFSMFDNDAAGLRAGLVYQERFGIEPLGFDLGYKDLTDTLEIMGLELTKIKLLHLL